MGQDAAQIVSPYEIARASRSGSNVLLAEPSGHVNDAKFAAELSAAMASGFEVASRPQIARSMAALLVKL